jgi:Uri superfamily endonuclease
MTAPDLSTRGTYALVYACPRSAAVSVGALGPVSLRRGSLVYVGSAFGSGGLAGRLRHHLRPPRRPRWHLDYVRPHLALRGAWFASGSRALEHRWAALFASLPGATVPRSGFGASDCACRSHLIQVRRRDLGPSLRSPLERTSGASAVEYASAVRLRRAVRV